MAMTLAAAIMLVQAGGFIQSEIEPDQICRVLDGKLYPLSTPYLPVRLVLGDWRVATQREREDRPTLRSIPQFAKWLDEVAAEYPVPSFAGLVLKIIGHEKPERRLTLRDLA